MDRNTDGFDLKSFLANNQAKDFRDKIQVLYEELLCVKISQCSSIEERDQICRRFLRKAATHALNSLQETREDFMNKYLAKYHQKMKEQRDARAQRMVKQLQQVQKLETHNQIGSQPKIIKYQEQYIIQKTKDAQVNVNNNPIRIMKDILLNGAEIFASKKQKTTPIMNKKTYQEEQQQFEEEEMKTLKRFPDEIFHNNNENGPQFDFKVQNYTNDGKKLQQILIQQDEKSEERIGLAFTQDELELINQDGPLIPKHEGAFEIKESYMEMSSSDEEEKGNDKQMLTFNQLKKYQKDESKIDINEIDFEKPENAQIFYENFEFPQNFNFDNIFYAICEKKNDNKLFKDQYKKLQILKFNKCKFISEKQFNDFLNSLKGNICLIGILNESTLKTLVIREIHAAGKEGNFQILSCFNNPKLNAEVFRNLTRFELDVDKSFVNSYNNNQSAFNLLRFMKSLQILKIKFLNLNMKIIDEMLKKIYGEGLQQSNLQNLNQIEISQQNEIQEKESFQLDGQMQEFILQILSKQRAIEHINFKNLDLSSSTIFTMIFNVIIKFPNLNLQEIQSKVESIPKFQSNLVGQYKVLKFLDLSGNQIANTKTQCVLLSKVFEYMQCIESLNLECCRYGKFSNFKKYFLIPFFQNDGEYKPYQNTLVDINFNMTSNEFLQKNYFSNNQNIKSQMSLQTSKKILQNALEEFSNLKSLKIDFFQNFIRSRHNQEELRNKFKSQNLYLEIKFKNSKIEDFQEEEESIESDKESNEEEEEEKQLEDIQYQFNNESSSQDSKKILQANHQDRIIIANDSEEDDQGLYSEHRGSNLQKEFERSDNYFDNFQESTQHEEFAERNSNQQLTQNELMELEQKLKGIK